jgi:plastocyanin
MAGDATNGSDLDGHGLESVKVRAMFGRTRVCARVLGAALTLSLFAPAASAFAQDADATVNMQGVSFLPAEVHIAPGQTVLWNNASTFAHTVTADDGSFDSGLLDPGATFTMSFDAPGVYAYYCQPHGAAGGHGMAAIIVVDDPDAAAAPSVDAAPQQPAQDGHQDEYFADH